jgi:hypothetical protein
MTMRIESACPECGAAAYLQESGPDRQLQFECSNIEDCGHAWIPRGRALAVRTLSRPREKINGRNREYFSPLGVRAAS